MSEKQDRWTRLSESLERMRTKGMRSLSREEIESMGPAYRAVVSDLAFARSQGASDDLTAYLNDLAGRAHGALYASRSARARGAVRFIAREFPALFRSTFRYSLVAMLLFVVGWIAATYVIYAMEDAWMSVIPEPFRDALTQHRPDPADASRTQSVPMDPAQMSGFIMTNNIKEGMKAFAGGVTFGIYSVYTLLKNGLVIGGIVMFTCRFVGIGFLLPLLLPHGIIELTAVFICGGAGLMIGSAMIAPGNVRRADAIRTASGTALKLFVGAVPMFVVAALIEGFVTPAAIPNYAKLAFAGLTAVGLVAYLGFAGEAKPESPSPSPYSTPSHPL